MASDAVKIARINLKMQREKAFSDAIGKAIDSTGEVLSNVAATDAGSLMLGWLVVEFLQNTRAPWADPSLPPKDPAGNFIGPIAAGAIQTAMIGAFTLNGFAESGLFRK